MSKPATLLLITVLVLSSLLMGGCASAQSILKPTVPEFTLKIIDSPYYVPPKYSTPDPYTGETALIDNGYWAQNGTVMLTIKNQLLASNNDGNGHVLSLFYTIERKGHFEAIWSAYPPSIYARHKQYLPASNSEFTIANVFYGKAGSIGDMRLGEITGGGEVDFRVRAFIGYTTTLEGQALGLAGVPREPYYYENYTGQESDWSDIQTLRIPTGQVTSQPTPTATPYQEPQAIEQQIILGLTVTVAVLGVGLGLLIYLIKRK
jgi:hypothetical protein